MTAAAAPIPGNSEDTSSGGGAQQEQGEGERDDLFAGGARARNERGRRDDSPHPLLESERNQRIGSEWLSYQENRLRREEQRDGPGGGEESGGVGLDLVQFLRNGRRQIFEHQNHPGRL